MGIIIPVKVIVDGDCLGEVLLVDRRVSFYGEVDPVNGVIRGVNESVKGKALIFRGGRGSTVGSYIIYGLKYYGNSPSCMIVSDAEPIIITGAVLADTPLFVALDYDELVSLVKGKPGGLHAWHKRGEKHVELEEK